MSNKSNKLSRKEPSIIAGLSLSDNNIEIIGVRETQTVVFSQNGRIKPFKSFTSKIYNQLKAALFNDKMALVVLETYYPNVVDETRKVELYTYFMYGDVDHTADIIGGVLQPCENFRHTEDCISLDFDSKTIDVNGKALNKRFIKMLDAWKIGIPDKTIAADVLKVALSTYDFHKSKLFKLLNVDNKPQAVAVAYQNHVLC